MKKFTLDNHPKIKAGFNTPDSYFDELPALILEKVAIHEPKNTPVFRLRYFIIGAAAVLIIALGVPFLMEESASTIDQIDHESIEYYLTTNGSVSTYDLLSLMENKDFDALQVDMDFEDETVEHLLITNPNIENYLTEY